MQHLGFKELANEGERLCKLGDCKNGITYFEEALKQFNASSNCDIGNNASFDDITDPKSLNILSIIYNQMGNAYFYLQNYTKALECHKKDLSLCEKLDDASGKAKSCGNIGNTLQLLGDYDEAILYSLRNLEISIQLGDTVIFNFIHLFVTIVPKFQIK
jgi:G-protein signaling modulator 2